MTLLPASRLGRAAVLLAAVLLLVVANVAWLHRPQPPTWLSIVDPELALPPVLAKTEPGSQHGDSYTVTYDVRDLVNYLARQPTAKLHTKKAGPMTIDELAGVIVASIQANWGKTSTLEEINGTQLVIHTRKYFHEQIAGELEALRRLADAAVLVQTRLYELDRAVYEEQIAPQLVTEAAPQGPRYGAATPASVIGAIVAAAAKANDQTAFMVPSGQTVRVFSRRRAVASASNSDQFQRAPALHGVVVQAAINVSFDRRFILVHLTQEITEQSAARTVALYSQDDPVIAVTVPNLAKKTLESPPVEVADSGALVLPLPPLAGRDDERVALLVIQPTLHIESEEAALRAQAQPLQRSIEWLKKATLP